MATPPMDPAHLTPEYLAEYNGDPITAVAVLCVVLNTVFVIFRILARHLQAASYGWDDALVGLSWAVNIGLSAALLLNLKYGGAHHIEYLFVHPELVPYRGTIDLYVEPILYSAAAALPKLAILVLYLRIFTDRVTRSVSWILIGIISCLAVINIFVIAFQCNPRSKAWDQTAPGYCNNIEAHFIWGTFPNILTDFVMLLMPIPTVWRLQASLQTKIGLLATFAVGSIGMITSIIRWSEFFDNRFVGGDQSWYDNPLSIWLVVEPTAYLISACLLSYRSLLRNLAATRPASYMLSLLGRSRSSATKIDDEHDKSTSSRDDVGLTNWPSDGVQVRREFDVHRGSAA